MSAVELTIAEREAIYKAGDHHPEICDCTGYAVEYLDAPGSQHCPALVETFAAVESIVAARVKAAKVEALRDLADDRAALEAVRLRIEDELVEWRDEHLFMARRNGFAIADRDGRANGIIRFGTEMGFAIGLRFLADRIGEQS